MTFEKEGTLSTGVLSAEEVSGPITKAKAPPEVVTAIDRERDALLNHARAHIGYPSSAGLAPPTPNPEHAVNSPNHIVMPVSPTLDVVVPLPSPVTAFVPNTPEYQAVIDHAAKADADTDGLKLRAARITLDVADLVEEAIRVRDENRVQIDTLRMLPRPPPASLVAWVRSEVKRLPVAKDHFPVLSVVGGVAVTLGELRAWLRAIDGDAPRDP